MMTPDDIQTHEPLPVNHGARDTREPFCRNKYTTPCQTTGRGSYETRGILGAGGTHCEVWTGLWKKGGGEKGRKTREQVGRR
jgi:hypothetical protein